MARFATGDWVVVRYADLPGHIRTPFYVRGKTGVIARLYGQFPNPEELAYGRNGLPARELYQLCFAQNELWPDYSGSSADTVHVDIFEHWLIPA